MRTGCKQDGTRRLGNRETGGDGNRTGMVTGIRDGNGEIREGRAGGNGNGNGYRGEGMEMGR
jgi:hypothetical protein